MTRFANSRVTALLGPTNTGKTFLAIDRMLGHESGVIGFPLRLLARENYDRVAKAKGRHAVALVTGEEKIVPPHARYFCCTVESMPLERDFAFLAIDEVQLAADPERGHVFTDRLLKARGLEETMFLGAATIRPILRRLVPEAENISRPRFSRLSFAGEQHINRLPPRSAVVAFSAAEVYATAELIRRRRGGTAVVMGALSPRTRNAQVEMFEAGEVDYLVATDAIGMGLNLNLDHVAFADLGKFDGQRRRRLTAPEVAQIAGRAGRHMNDGTFGCTLEAGTMAPEIVEAVENHRFEPLQSLFWRSRDLDFRSPEALLASLEAKPPAPQLIRVRDAEDQAALKLLVGNPDIRDKACHPAAVRLLWDVCQIPDFQKELSDRHGRLLKRVFTLLIEDDGCLPPDWVARQLARIDRSDGDIDLLVQRIGQIRTWTYVSHRGDWLSDPGHWQARAREIEDRLSDALHERLTQRFVDRRTTLMVQRLRDRGHLLGAVKADGEVLVEGEAVGRLEGFSLLLQEGLDQEFSRPLVAAARQAVKMETPRRLQRMEADNDGAFRLLGDRLYWRGQPVARLKAGDDLLLPRVVPLAGDFLEGGDRERLRRRLAEWLERHLRRRLGKLFALREAPLEGAARGLAFQLVETLGLLERAAAQVQFAALSRDDRRTLSALGVRLGSHGCCIPALAKDKSDGAGIDSLRQRLWGLRHGGLPDLPLPHGEALFRPAKALPDSLLAALGYYALKPSRQPRLAIRADCLERLAQEAQRRLRRPDSGGLLCPDAPLAALLEADAETLIQVLKCLGYREDAKGAGLRWSKRRIGKAGGDKTPAGRRTKGTRPDPDSPFALLGDLQRKKDSGS